MPQVTLPSELPEETAQLIDYILLCYHQKHRHQLPQLLEMARRVEQVHAAKPEVPAGLADVLQRALGELEVHMKKEELMIFPAMRRSDGSRPLDGPTSMLREDHSDQERLLEQISLLTDDFTPPANACGTWRGDITFSSSSFLRSRRIRKGRPITVSANIALKICLTRRATPLSGPDS